MFGQHDRRVRSNGHSIAVYYTTRPDLTIFDPDRSLGLGSHRVVSPGDPPAILENLDVVITNLAGYDALTKLVDRYRTLGGNMVNAILLLKENEALPPHHVSYVDAVINQGNSGDAVLLADVLACPKVLEAQTWVSQLPADLIGLFAESDLDPLSLDDEHFPLAGDTRAHIACASFRQHYGQELAVRMQTDRRQHKPAPARQIAAIVAQSLSRSHEDEDDLESFFGSGSGDLADMMGLGNMAVHIVGRGGRSPFGRGRGPR